MNKAFKVLWNRLRGSYVVASEATAAHGKSGKAAKTVLAAAAASLVACGGVSAADSLVVNFDYVKDQKTTKFLSGKGQALEIQTNAGARKMVDELMAAKSVAAVRSAIAQFDDEKKTAILAGVAGGGNYYDGGFGGLISKGNALSFALPESYKKVIASPIWKQFETLTKENVYDIQEQPEVSKKEVEGGTSIKIGGMVEGKATEPVLLATVGGDRVINTGLAYEANVLGLTVPFSSYKDFATAVVRKGDATIEAVGGNLFGLTGGSSAVNVSGIDVKTDTKLKSAKFAGKSTSVTIDGNVDVTLAGPTNAAGVLLSGSAIAMGGEAASTVTGNSTLNIKSTHDEANKISGMTVGVLGGGLAAATGNGSATTNVQGTTNVKIDSGVVVGAFGGGAALSTELEGRAWNAVKGLKLAGKLTGDNIFPADLGGDVTEKNSPILVNGGKATANSGNISVESLGKSLTVALAGGGLAAASSGGNGGKAEVAVHTGDISITLGDETTPVLDLEHRKTLREETAKILTSLRAKKLDPLLEAIPDAEKNWAGAHVGTVGGSIVVARMPSGVAGTVATASAESGDIVVNLKGGYNVATLGGGMTAALGKLASEGTQAVSKVESTMINISGGDNVLVMSGGAAYATADTKGMNRPSSKVLSRSTVLGTATVNVTGGSADGIFGGGLAVDDTAASVSNAIVDVGGVVINVSDGTVFAANPQPLGAFAKGLSDGAPSNGTYVKDTADLLAVGTTKAAIVGGGIASGAGAQATVGDEGVRINLTGGKVEGNVYAGGAATLGGASYVPKAEVVVNGSTVTGAIYGGGLVGSPRNNNFKNDEQYGKASSIVDDVTISLLDGSVGNIYAGGYVYKDSEGVTNQVKKARVILTKEGVFTGTVIDGSGAEDSGISITPAAYAFKNGQTVKGFDAISAQGTVTNLAYEFGSRETTTVSGGTVEFSALKSDKAATLAVGTKEAAGMVAVKPGYANTVEFKVDNGFLALNTDAETARGVLAAVPSPAQAAAYVTGSVDLSKAMLTIGNVDSSVTTDLAVGSNGQLIANAAGETVVTGTTNFAKGSTIHFVNVADAKDQAVKLQVGEGAPVTSVDNVLYHAVKAQDGNSYTFAQRSGFDLAAVGLDGFSHVGFLASVTGAAATNKGAQFVSSFLDESTAGVHNGNRAQQINAAVNLAAAAGVQTAAIDGTMTAIDAAGKRISLANEFRDGGVLFAEASGKHFTMGGGSNFGEIKADLGGLIVGGEYTMKDWTFGALANLGGGSVDGRGKNAGVKNDLDYYGFELYGAKRIGMFNLGGQIGYLTSSNDVSHKTSVLNKASVDADVFTIGVKGEARFDLNETTRVVPYVGVNYLRVGTDGYTTSQGVRVGSVDQNLWSTPIGVMFAGDLRSKNGWMWTPSVDVAYIPIFGDDTVDAKTDVGAVAHTSMDVWTNNVGRMKLGLKVQKDNLGFGVEAGAAAGSDNMTEVFGQVRVDYCF